jgi:hypothetical protein
MYNNDVLVYHPPTTPTLFCSRRTPRELCCSCA